MIIGRKQADDLILSHRDLVRKIAYRYKNFGFSMDDLVSEGTIGLIVAARNFDDGKGCSLATYATFWIKSRIMQYIIGNWSMVKFGTTKENRNCFFRDSSRFARDVSLNVKTASGTEMMEMLPESRESPEDRLIREEERSSFKRSLAAFLKKLPSRTKEIFVRRRLKAKADTLATLSGEMGISKERIRQIEQEAFAGLRAIGY